MKILSVIVLGLVCLFCMVSDVEACNGVSGFAVGGGCGQVQSFNSFSAYSVPTNRVFVQEVRQQPVFVRDVGGGSINNINVNNTVERRGLFGRRVSSSSQVQVQSVGGGGVNNVNVNNVGRRR